MPKLVYEGFYESVPRRTRNQAKKYIDWVTQQPDHHNVVRKQIGHYWHEFELFWRQSGSNANWIKFVVRTDRLDRFVQYAFVRNPSEAEQIIKMIGKTKVVE
jgi:hypothetical protein